VEIEDITLEEEGLVGGIASTVDIGRRGFIRVIIMLVSSHRFFAFCTQFILLFFSIGLKEILILDAIDTGTKLASCCL
jgi:hypothetical protein